MKFRNTGTVSQVKTLLENVEYLRDNKKDFIKQYRYYYPSDDRSEETLARAWRLVQQYEVPLRGKEWEMRQRKNATSKDYYIKFRSQEKYEDLSGIFAPISFKKETWFESFIRKIF